MNSWRDVTLGYIFESPILQQPFAWLKVLVLIATLFALVELLYRLQSLFGRKG